MEKGAETHGDKEHNRPGPRLICKGKAQAAA